MHAIEITGLSKRFKVKGQTVVEAVKGLSLTIGQGEVFGFLGPNGAGKSTTIKTIMGLIRPTGGEVFLMGQPASSPRARKHIGYLPENPAFYDFLTAEEYLLFVGRTFGMDGHVLEERMASVLKLLELWDARRRPLRGYSKGMVQRLGLAQTLIHDPDVYILDEPMSGLDPLGRALVKQIILDLKRNGKCVFFSTHITSDVEAVCDRVGMLFRGELAKVDRVETILAAGTLGYTVRLKNGLASGQNERYVRKEDLATVMKEVIAEGQEIVSIEPKRKDLEAFFLDVIKVGK